jgi:hypothetical protein
MHNLTSTFVVHAMRRTRARPPLIRFKQQTVHYRVHERPVWGRNERHFQEDEQEETPAI